MILETPAQTLTARQKVVALNVSRGLTNRQIARELSISEQTVKNHLREIYGKSGTGNRVELAVWIALHPPETGEA